MHIDPEQVAHSISQLGTLDLAHGLEPTLGRALEAVRLLLDTDAAAITLHTPNDTDQDTDQAGTLQWVAVSGPRARHVQATQHHLGQGPSAEAFTTARPIAVWDATSDQRWQPIRQALAAAGIQGVLSIPLQVAGAPIGTLDLYTASPRLWDDTHIAAASAYAAVVADLLTAAATAQLRGTLATQLDWALHHRMLIERAKGVLMNRHDLDEHAAFERIRAAARTQQCRAADIAKRVLDGEDLPHLHQGDHQDDAATQARPLPTCPARHPDALVWAVFAWVWRSGRRVSRQGQGPRSRHPDTTRLHTQLTSQPHHQHPASTPPPAYHPTAVLGARKRSCRPPAT